MTTRKKQQTPAPPAAPYVPTDYEQGAFAVLEMLNRAVGAIHDAEHEARMVSMKASPELRALLAGINASANIASHIRAEVEKMAQRHLNERTVAARDTTPAASPR